MAFGRKSLKGARRRGLEALLPFLLISALTLAFLPFPSASAQTANPTRDLPDRVQRGDTFDVVITFTAPQDNFNAIGLTDIVPAGWAIEADASECTPVANAVKVTPEENKVEIVWYGPFDAGTAFMAVYHVTVPSDAAYGTYNFTDGTLLYYIAGSGPFTENVTGDSQVLIPAPPPEITAIDPSQGVQGETLNVTITGQNLTGATSVAFTDGITVNSFSVDSDTQITASITITQDAAPGMRDLSVRTPGGTGTLTEAFKVIGVVVTRDLPDTPIALGQIFEVKINFVAPCDHFNAIGLTDIAPQGWGVQVDKTWCEPDAGAAKPTPENAWSTNKAEFIWYGPYTEGTQLEAVYKVKVPEDAQPGTYTFPDGALKYYIGGNGPYTANVTGENQIQVITDITPPPVPDLISPADELITSDTTPAFDWSDVQDPSGVTYTLQIGNADFSKIYFEKKGIKTSEYELADTEALAEGTYRWRVKAVDSAGNESDWTAARSFVIAPVGTATFAPAVILKGEIAAGSVEVKEITFKSIPAGAKITPDVKPAATSEERQRAAEAAAAQGYQLIDVGIACEMEFENISAQDIEAAKIRMSVDRAWADRYGVNNIFIIRISDGTREVLRTIFVGYQAGRAVFEAYSPHGLSTFILAALLPAPALRPAAPPTVVVTPPPAPPSPHEKWVWIGTIIGIAAGAGIAFAVERRRRAL